MTKQKRTQVHILTQENYKPGDAEPEGYLAWHEWADVQRKAGLEQSECGRCKIFKFPQQLSGKFDEFLMQSRPVCNQCLDLAA